MKHKTLHVLPDLKYGSAARQLALLVGGLDRDRFDSRVVALGADGPARQWFADAGIGVESLGWARSFDLRPLWTLRQRVDAFQPDCMHAWGPEALRAVCIGNVRGKGVNSPAIVVSRPLPRRGLGFGKHLDAWLLDRADSIVVTSAAEAEQCRRLGLPANKLVRVRPGAPDAVPMRSREELLATLPPLPAGVRLVACVGPLEARKSLKTAVWAFDVVIQIYADLHLLLIGSGPEASSLTRFAHSVGIADRVHLLGDRADLADLLSLAEVVWTCGREGGVGAALEAMAAARPVVATRQPATAEVVADGTSGLLVEVDDPVALVRQTRTLLDNEALRHRMAEEGRRRAVEHFAAAAAAKDYERVYDDLKKQKSRVA